MSARPTLAAKPYQKLISGPSGFYLFQYLNHFGSGRHGCTFSRVQSPVQNLVQNNSKNSAKKIAIRNFHLRFFGHPLLLDFLDRFWTGVSRGNPDSLRSINARKENENVWTRETVALKSAYWPRAAWPAIGGVRIPYCHRTSALHSNKNKKHPSLCS